MVETKTQAAEGKVVSIHYKLTIDGTVIDESGDHPLAYLHGHGGIVPGLERQLTGKSVGDKLRAVVPPDEGYGERLGDGQKSLPRNAFPLEEDIEEGMQFAAEGPDDDIVPFWIVSATADEVVVDFNHPLAGETLTFDVEIVGVRDPSAEELAHGHVHEPGSHHHH